MYSNCGDPVTRSHREIVSLCDQTSFVESPLFYLFRDFLAREPRELFEPESGSSRGNSLVREREYDDRFLSPPLPR